MIDRRNFNALVRDTISNLYDFAALETHPLLFKIFTLPADFSGTPAEYIRQSFLEAIEQLKPARKDLNLSAPEWRAYYILQKRYIEGMDAKELAAALAISDRQIRRDHHRAIESLATLLWSRLQLDRQVEESAHEDDSTHFEVQKERIDLRETCQGVVNTLKRRLDEQNIRVDYNFAALPVSVLADRVILRQLLISLFNAALQLQTGGEVDILTRRSGQNASIEISFRPDELWEPAQEGEEESTLDAVRYWSERINAQFTVTLPDGTEPRAHFNLLLPLADQRVILVVDDQLPAINLFKRYLAGDDVTVVGATRADQVLPLARELAPALITLDVMMPQTDGWEILQTLKLDENTHHIPVLICSAWEEPELARSLGAAGFLKKPITQKQLRDALESLGF
ncbi:MAG: response regulator [Chloroflexi bacterium]|nr:response regulator [Chloroflexota bacterium]